MSDAGGARTYLTALDASARRIAAGKRGSIPIELDGILDRRGFTAERWLDVPGARHAFAVHSGTTWCAAASRLWVA